MTNPSPFEPARPVRSTPPMGEASLSAVPKSRVFLWLIVGIVTVVGLVLYFMYGDYVSPMLV